MALLQAGKAGIGIFHALLDLCLVSDQIGPYPEVFFHRQVGEDAAAFRHHDQAALHHLLGIHAGDIFPLEGDLAALGHDQAADGPQGAGFARPVGTDQGHDLVLFHIQADAAQGLNAAIAYLKVFDF